MIMGHEKTALSSIPLCLKDLSYRYRPGISRYLDQTVTTRMLGFGIVEADYTQSAPPFQSICWFSVKHEVQD